jgi:hypothetical protein
MKRIVLRLAFFFLLIFMPIGGSVGDLGFVKEVSAQTTRFDSPPPYEEEADTPPPPEEYEDIEREFDEPPPVEFEEAPDVVVVPSGTSYIYMVPDTPGFYFYNGNWYRNYRGAWFRSRSYDGPWGFVDASFVPRVVVDVPLEYVFFLPANYHRIHYRDLHRSWRSWDQGRHWNRQAWFKHELRDDIRRERFSRIRAEREKSHHTEYRKRDRFDSHNGRGGGHEVGAGKKGSDINKRAASMGIGRPQEERITEGRGKDKSGLNKRAASMGIGGGDKENSGGGQKGSSDKGGRNAEKMKSGNANVQRSHTKQEEKDYK